MTTPNEEITGYGGQARTEANAQSTSAPAQPTGQTGQAGTTQASSSASAPSAEELKAQAREAGEQVKNQGKAQLDSYRGTAADELEKVAQSAKAAAAELENQDRTGLSHYVSDMAQSMVSLADNLRGKSVDELVTEVNRLARNNPGLFITGTRAEGDSLDKVAADIAALPGRTGLIVQKLTDKGAETLVSRNADERFAIASVFKLYVLAEIDRLRSSEPRG